VRALKNLYTHFGFASQKEMAMAIKGLSEATLSRALNEQNPVVLSRESRLAIARFLGERCQDEAELEAVLEQTGWELTDEEWEEARERMSRKGEILHGVPFLGSEGQFVGREKEVDALVERLIGPGIPSPRLVVVQGLPGVGKTRLVEHVVRQKQAVREFYRDGIYWLNLEHKRELGALADLVQDLESGEQAVAEAEMWRFAVHHLRGKRVLLILDGVAEAIDLTRWATLVPRGGLVVTTRRSDLGLPEYLLRVEPMGIEESLRLLLRDIGKADVGEEDLKWIASSVEGLPLALSIIGRVAWLERGFARLVAEMREDLLQVLEFGSSKRHNVRLALDMSYSRLSQRGRTLFQLLGKVPQPFSVEAIAHVLNWSSAEVGKGFKELIKLGLVQSLIPGRYSMHRVLQEYAAKMNEEISAELLTTGMCRFAEYYLHVSRQAREAWNEGRTQEAIALWQDNLPHILQGFRYAVALGMSREAVDYLASTGAYLALSGMVDVLEEWLEGLGTTARTPEEQLEVHMYGADALSGAGRPHLALEHAQFARTLASQQGKHCEWVQAILAEVRCLYMLGRVDEAWALANREELYEAEERVPDMLRALVMITRGELAHGSGNIEAAYAFYSLALDQLQQVSDKSVRVWKAFLATNLGKLLIKLDVPVALKFSDLAATLWERAGVKKLWAEAMLTKAAALIALGRLSEAEQVIDLLQPHVSADFALRPHFHQVCARLAGAQKMYEIAEREFTTALAQAEGLPVEAKLWFEYGHYLELWGKFEQAIEAWEKGQETALRQGNQFLRGLITYRLGRLLWFLDRREEARRLLLESAEDAVRARDYYGAAEAYELLGEYELAERWRAEGQVKQAIARSVIAQILGGPPPIGDVIVKIGDRTAHFPFIPFTEFDPQVHARIAARILDGWEELDDKGKKWAIGPDGKDTQPISAEEQD